MPRIVPLDWMPRCPMRRIVTHWTAGGYRATEHDRRCYHLLIEGDGGLVRGRFPIHRNAPRPGGLSPGSYAAHTRGCNTGSIGIAICGMGGARERPFLAGPWPMTPLQYRHLALAVADLCERYAISVTPETVLGHGEVEARLGIPQRGKWDPMRLPWEPDLPPEAVGAAFREAVRALLRPAE